MENNEDKRQITVIAEAINLIEDYTSIYFTHEGCSFDYLTPEGVKSMLESLLPKEREMMKNCFSIGHVKGFMASQGDKPIEPSEYFNETFKPYEK